MTSGARPLDLDPGAADPILGIHRLQQAHFAPASRATRGITVPALVDTTTGQVVTNDFAQITLDLSTQWTAHHRPGAPAAPGAYEEEDRRPLNPLGLVAGSVKLTV